MIISRIIRCFRKLYNLPHRYRQHRQALMDLAILTEVIDELDGRYLILLNGVPIGPGDGFYPGDRLEITFIDVPDDEIELWEKLIKTINNPSLNMIFDDHEDDKSGQ